MYGFIFLLPWQTHWLFEQKTLNKTGWEHGAMRIYGTEILLGIIFILAIIYFGLLLRKDKKILRLPRKAWALRMTTIIALILLFSTNIFFALNREIALYKWTWVIQALALFFLLLAFQIKTKKLFLTLLGAGTLQTLFAIQQFATQKVFASKWLGMAMQNPELLGTPVIATDGARWLRAFGSLPHPNILGSLLVFTTLSGIFLLLKETHLSSRLKRRDLDPSTSARDDIRFPQKLLYFLTTLNFLGIILTFSRSALVAFFIALIFLSFHVFKKQNLQKPIAQTFKKLLIIVILFYLVFTVVYPQLILTRAAGAQRLEVKSNIERVEEYKIFPALLKNHWLIGAGLGNYTLALHEHNPNLQIWDYQPIHNSFLLEILEFGLVGIVLTALFIWFLFKSIPRLCKKLKFHAFSAPLITALFTLALFDHYLSTMYFGVMLSYIILYLILKKKQSNNLSI